MNYDCVSLKGKYYLKYMVHCKRKENGKKGTIQELYKQSQSLKIIRTVVQWPSYDGQDIYKEWVTVKHPEASQISHWKEGQ